MNDSFELRYRRLFEASRDGILILDAATGGILDANPFALRLLKWKREEALGKTVRELEVAGLDEARARATRELDTHEDARLDDVRLVTRDGGLVEVELVATAYAVGSQQVLQLTLRDISDRRRLEEQFRQAQKLEAVGRLAGGVAHDFNNLLAVINSYTELAVGDLRPDDPLRADLEEVQRAGARAAALTRQLLAFSRRQVMQPVTLSVNAVVGGLEKMLRRVIGEDVALRLALAPDLGNVRADPAQLEQVLTNLVVNSRDAMPSGGTLTIGTANAELDEAQVRARPGSKAGAYVVLSVSDTGCGMDHETAARVFEPFFTTKGPGKGTGLGLSTVYGIVRQSGGHVDMESAVGKGTTFRVYLPRDWSPIEAPGGRHAPPPHGTETVLVVEDDEGVRTVAQRVLAPLGYRVLAAATAAEALRVCAEPGEGIQLLLTDIVLPGMDGSELARQLTSLRPGLEVLYMSGYTDVTMGARGPTTSAAGFLQKPFTASELARRVRKALDAGKGR